MPNGKRAAVIVAFLTISYGLVACKPESSSAVHTNTKDSAGVVIVESSGFPDEGAGDWSLDQTPTISVGSVEGSAEYQLSQVSSGLRLNDGRVVVADGGSLDVRIYDSDGTFLSRWGRKGEGPGEFQSLALVGLLGSDTIVIMDRFLRRRALLHAETGFISHARVEAEVGVMLVSNGMFSDGSIVLGGGLSLRDVMGPDGRFPDEGPGRSDVTFRSATRDGSLTTEFGPYPGPEYYFRTTPRQGGGTVMSVLPLPFGKSPVAIARADRLCLGSADNYEIREYDAAGDLRRIMRVTVAPTPATRDNIAAFVEDRTAELTDPREITEVRNSYRDYPFPETVPAYESLFLDSEGFLWVEDFLKPNEEQKTWSVFDSSFVPVTQLSLPADNQVLEIGADYVLVLYTDATDVEYVRVHHLNRGE